MQVLIDILTITIGTYLFFKAYKRALDADKTCPAAFVQMVIYIFNCLPLAFNYLIGIPQFRYDYWYVPLRDAMLVEPVNIIYDLYIVLTMILLHRYTIRRHYKHKILKTKKKWFFDNNFFWGLLMTSPVIYIVLTGQAMNYLKYGGGGAGLITRLHTNNFFNMYTYILISCLGFCMIYFRRRIKPRDIIWLLLYSFALIYICGKRYIIPIMLIMYLYFYINSENYNAKSKQIIERTIPILGIALLAFSAIYLVVVKGDQTNRYVVGGFEAVYDTLRVDFGRDDVTKYVIWKELFLHEHILEYPGQSFLSLLFIYIPRSLWANKPYQHFQYLTASILNTSINKIPAGTTPSWFEMCVANFGIIGLVVGIIGMLYLCKKVNGIPSTELRGICMMLVIALLTQGLDAFVVFIAIFLVAGATKLILGNRSITIKGHNKKANTWR